MGTLEISGKTLELDTDGHLANREDWNEEIAAEFAKQVLRLVRDEELRRRLGRAGRDFAKVHFSSQLALDRLKAIGKQSKD